MYIHESSHFVVKPKATLVQRQIIHTFSRTCVCKWWPTSGRLDERIRGKLDERVRISSRDSSSDSLGTAPSVWASELSSSLSSPVPSMVSVRFLAAGSEVLSVTWSCMNARARTCKRARAYVSDGMFRLCEC